MSHLLDQFRFLNVNRANFPMGMARRVMSLVTGKTCIVAVGSMTKSCAQRMASTVPVLARGRFM